MRYASNPKHSEPWQRGKRGTLCPKDMRPLAQDLLERSELVGKKRYAVHKRKAYCALKTQGDVWHGYPVGWKKVPHKLQKKWLNEGHIKRSDLRRYKD